MINNIDWELINLNPKKIKLLEYLEKETEISRESYINDLLNEKSDWEDYKDIKSFIEWEKEPNKVFLNKKESDEYLNNLFLTNSHHLHDYKH